MVQTDIEIKAHTITCIKCRGVYTATLDELKFRPGMKPYVCELCSKEIKLGDLKKLEKFVLDHYEVRGTIVDFIISKLNKDLLSNL